MGGAAGEVCCVLAHAGQGVCWCAPLLSYSLALFYLREHFYMSATSKESKRVNRATYRDTLLLCPLLSLLLLPWFHPRLVPAFSLGIWGGTNTIVRSRPCQT